MWTIVSGKVIAPIFINMTHKLENNILITCAHFFMNILPWGGQSSAKHHPPPTHPELTDEAKSHEHCILLTGSSFVEYNRVSGRDG